MLRPFIPNRNVIRLSNTRESPYPIYLSIYLWEYRLKGIIQAILSTGDGKAPETAWFVIYPADEYNIVNRQGFTATEFTFVEPYFDYISIEKNPLKIEGFYFNVKKLLKEYNRKFYER